MNLTPLVLALAFVTVLAAMRWLSRPHTVIQISDGRASLVRGSPPAGLIEELTRAARHAPAVSGRVELTGSGRRLRIAMPGLEERAGQQIRNVVVQFRDRIR
jgi:hypothetical protein